MHAVVRDSGARRAPVGVRWAGTAATLAAVTALAACGAGDPPRAADGTKVTACADGTCEVDVRGRAYFRPDADLDLPPVTITVSKSTVEVVAEEHTATGSSRMYVSLGDGAGATGDLNQLHIKIVWVSDDRAVLRISVP